MKLSRLLIALFIIVFTFTGCSPKDIASKKEEKDTLKGNVEVWSQGNEFKAMQVAAKNFENVHKNVKVQVENNDSSDLLQSYVVGQFNGKAPDIVTVKDDILPEILDKASEEFVNLSQNISKDKFFDSKIKNATVDSKVMGVPYTIYPQALLYRKDVFSDNNINVQDIKTWREYINACLNIRSNTNKDIKALTFEEGKGSELYELFLSQLRTCYFDENNKAVFDSKKSINTINMITNLDSLKLMSGVSGSYSMIQAAKDDTTIGIIADSTFLRNLSKEYSNMKDKWGVMMLPAFEAGGAREANTPGSNILISSNTKNKDAAIAFALFAASDKDTINEITSEYGILTSYVPAYSESIFDKGDAFYGNEKTLKLYRNIAFALPYLNYSPYISDIRKEFVSDVKSLSQNNMDSKEFMKELQEKVMNRINAQEH